MGRALHGGHYRETSSIGAAAAPVTARPVHAPPGCPRLGAVNPQHPPRRGPGCPSQMAILQDAYTWLPYVSCMLIFIFTLSYGLGPGGVTCVLPTEMFVQTYRPAAYAVSGVMIWLGLFIIGLAFPFIEESMGPFCFIFFLAYSISMAVYSFWLLPETKDRSMMEILESFNLLNFRGENVSRSVCTRL